MIKQVHYNQEFLLMSWLAVRRTSSLGQSRKERLALVPAATLILSWTLESTLISQFGSEPTFSRCRDRSLCSVRSTVHSTTRGHKVRNKRCKLRVHSLAASPFS